VAEPAGLLLRLSGAPGVLDGPLRGRLAGRDVEAGQMRLGEQPPGLGKSRVIAEQLEDRDEPLDFSDGVGQPPLALGVVSQPEPSQLGVGLGAAVTGSAGEVAGLREDLRRLGQSAAVGERSGEVGEQRQASGVGVGSSAAARPSRLVAAGTSTRAKARLPAAASRSVARAAIARACASVGPSSDQ
jgi:hypothetical protein